MLGQRQCYCKIDKALWWKSTAHMVLRVLKFFDNRSLRIWSLGFPWWLRGKESACQHRGCRFSPWSWKIPHTMEQLSCVPQLLSMLCRAWEPPLLNPPATSAEAGGPGPVLCTCAGHLQRNPCPSQLEGEPKQQRRPSTPKSKYIITFLKKEVESLSYKWGLMICF